MRLEDPIPAGFSVRSTITGSTSDGDPVDCSFDFGDGSVFACDVAALDPGQSFRNEVQGTYREEGTFTNTAAASTETPETDTADNMSSVQTTVGDDDGDPVDLRLTKSFAAAEPLPLTGDDAGFDLVVVNDGPATARNVVVQDFLFFYLLRADGTDPACTDVADGSAVIRCAIGDLEAGESRRLRINVTLSTTGAPFNVAAVFGDAPELDFADNDAFLTTFVCSQEGTPGNDDLTATGGGGELLCGARRQRHAVGQLLHVPGG